MRCGSRKNLLKDGYAPAIGFIHTGKPQSFVYDIVDIFKFESVVPVAFRVASRNPKEPERDVRLAAGILSDRCGCCTGLFRLLRKSWRLEVWRDRKPMRELYR
jgi:CRISPR/Cas system-associated endonuclease Cas1